MQPNKKSWALITGGTSGIGLELAKLAAKDHFNLVIVARTDADLHNVAADLRKDGVDVLTITKDLFHPNAPFEIYDELKGKGINIEILINNAGQGQYGLFVDEDIDRLLDIIQLNICSLTILTHLFVKDMVARKNGKILQLASIASETPGPWQAVYHGTKAYVLNFSEGLRNELLNTGVTVTALLPGATESDFFNKADMNDSKILDSKLSDPAQVAKDGYEAMMKGDDKIISGLKNKILTGSAQVLPDTVIAAQMNKMQGPREEQ